METTPKPPNDKKPETNHHYVTMLNKQGQKYHCSVPLIQDEPTLNTEGSTSEDLNQQQITEEKRSSKVSQLCQASLNTFENITIENDF